MIQREFAQEVGDHLSQMLINGTAFNCGLVEERWDERTTDESNRNTPIQRIRAKLGPERRERHGNRLNNPGGFNECVCNKKCICDQRRRVSQDARAWSHGFIAHLFHSSPHPLSPSLLLSLFPHPVHQTELRWERADKQKIILYIVVL